MTIFYFTSTGNSLYVAKRLGGNLLSIPQVLKSGKSIYNDDVTGIVYPCFFGGLPRIVKRFLDTVKIDASYIFAIMTYGSEQTNALDQMNKYCMAKGIRIDYMNTLLMVNNYLPMFKIEKELVKIPLREIEKTITVIINDVKNRKKIIPPTSFSNKFWGAVYSLGANKNIGENADKRLWVDNACGLCGVCKKVCPVNNITIINNVVFGHNCEGCLACIHHCPNKAIHIKGEKSSNRFRNENIQLDEIITANG
jgi:ferredoxin